MVRPSKNCYSVINHTSFCCPPCTVTGKHGQTLLVGTIQTVVCEGTYTSPCPAYIHTTLLLVQDAAR